MVLSKCEIKFLLGQANRIPEKSPAQQQNRVNIALQGQPGIAIGTQGLSGPPNGRTPFSGAINALGPIRPLHPNSPVGHPLTFANPELVNAKGKPPQLIEKGTILQGAILFAGSCFLRCTRIIGGMQKGIRGFPEANVEGNEFPPLGFSGQSQQGMSYVPEDMYARFFNSNEQQPQQQSQSVKINKPDFRNEDFPSLSMSAGFKSFPDMDSSVVSSLNFQGNFAMQKPQAAGSNPSSFPPLRPGANVGQEPDHGKAVLAAKVI